MTYKLSIKRMLIYAIIICTLGLIVMNASKLLNAIMAGLILSAIAILYDTIFYGDMIEKLKQTKLDMEREEEKEEKKEDELEDE